MLSITRSKKKKHDKILMLAKSKLNSNENLISPALIEMEINHEKFDYIYDYEGEKKYEKMQENVRNLSKKQKNMRQNSGNSRT